MQSTDTAPALPYVLITTKHRGVFAGFLSAARDEGRTVTLTRARNAIRFGTTRGFLELADTGPTHSSKIGATAPELTLYDVTSCTTCSDVAASAWQASA